MPRSAHRRAGSARRGLAGTVALALLAIAVAGCGVGAQSSPDVLSAKSVPSGLLQAKRPTTTTVPVPLGAAVTIYLEGPDRRLVPVTREVTWPATVAAALGQLADGPTAAEAARGLVSPASSLGPFGVGAKRGAIVAVNLPVGVRGPGQPGPNGGGGTSRVHSNRFPDHKWGPLPGRGPTLSAPQRPWQPLARAGYQAGLLSAGGLSRASRHPPASSAPATLASCRTFTCALPKASDFHGELAHSDPWSTRMLIFLATGSPISNFVAEVPKEIGRAATR